MNESSENLQDKYLGNYHFSETHSIKIKTSPEQIFAKICEMNFTGSFVTRLLFALRGFPKKTTTGIERLQDVGFVILEVVPNHEVILGLIGQFWKLSGNIQKVTRSGFLVFENPDFAKATWNFKIIRESEEMQVLLTETRILCPSEPARKRFTLYWRIIKPFSGIIRKQMLKQLKKQSESSK
jgi:hypothetical protein